MKILLLLLLCVIAGFAVYEKGNPARKETLRSKVGKLGALYKPLMAMVYGVSVALVAVPWTGYGLASGIIIAVSLAIGLSFGCGNAIAPALQDRKPNRLGPEWWQKGPFLDNYWLALVGLGFVRAAPVVAAVATVAPVTTIIVASTVSAPLAVWLARKKLGGPVNTDYLAPSLEWQMETVRSNKMWGGQDYLYGVLVCAVVIGIKTVT